MNGYYNLLIFRCKTWASIHFPWTIRLSTIHRHISIKLRCLFPTIGLITGQLSTSQWPTHPLLGPFKRLKDQLGLPSLKFCNSRTITRLLLYQQSKTYKYFQTFLKEFKIEMIDNRYKHNQKHQKSHKNLSLDLEYSDLLKKTLSQISSIKYFHFFGVIKKIISI